MNTDYNNPPKELFSLIDNVFSQKFDEFCQIPQEDYILMDDYEKEFIADYKFDDLFLNQDFSEHQHDIYV